MKARHKRLAIVVGGVMAVSIAAVLILNALNSNRNNMANSWV